MYLDGSHQSKCTISTAFAKLSLEYSRRGHLVSWQKKEEETEKQKPHEQENKIKTKQ
jgi:hypothetical protein